MTTIFTSLTREDIRKCIERGDDINARDSNGQYGFDRSTPFIHHCKNNNQEAVLELLNHNCLIRYRDLNGCTGLEYVCENGNFELLQKMLVYQEVRKSLNDVASPYSTLPIAVRNGRMDIYDILVANGANINFGGYYRTPLIYAVICGQYDMAIRLLNDGANPNIKDHMDLSPLSYCKNTDILLQLLHYNANVNDINAFLLHIKNIDIINILLKFGANPNIASKYSGDTPLMIAIDKESFEVAKLLLQYGADLHISGDDGISSFDRISKLPEDKRLQFESIEN